MKISFRLRPFIKWFVNIFTLAGIILSFFTLPMPIAVLVAVLGAIFSWCANWFIYKYPVFFLHSGSDIVAERNSRIAFLWGKSEYRNEILPELNILYETRKLAKLVYQTLRHWNANLFHDKKQNIIVSFVQEDDTKYSVFLYPGKRNTEKSNSVNLMESILSPNSEVQLKGELKPFLHNCADYANRQEMLEFMKSLENPQPILLNTCFVKNNKPIAYAKRHIKLDCYKYQKRENLDPSMIEFHQKWEDPQKTIPEVVERVSKINFKSA